VLDLGVKNLVLNDVLILFINHQPMSRADLEQVRKWAIAKLSRHHEISADAHQYLKLRETVDAILTRVTFVTPQSNTSLQNPPRQRSKLRLAWSNDLTDGPVQSGSRAVPGADGGNASGFEPA
jgi:hypothetical protein